MLVSLYIKFNEGWWRIFTLWRERRNASLLRIFMVHSTTWFSRNSYGSFLHLNLPSTYVFISTILSVSLAAQAHSFVTSARSCMQTIYRIMSSVRMYSVFIFSLYHLYTFLFPFLLCVRVCGQISGVEIPLDCNPIFIFILSLSLLTLGTLFSPWTPTQTNLHSYGFC